VNGEWGNTDDGDETGFHGCWRGRGKRRNSIMGCRKRAKAAYGAEIRCFAELNMKRKSHYCFGDRRIVEDGEADFGRGRG
jgi:hypothetical protein